MSTSAVPLERSTELSLALPADARYVSVARLFAAAVARDLGCDDELVEDVKVAISEACTNAIKAHNSASVPDPVAVGVGVSAELLSFEITDKGGGFSPEPVVADATPSSGLFEGSLGLLLIRSLFPDATIAANPLGGTTVRFSVRLSASS